jgi:nucleoside-diphosphate-sugar epimerase
MCLLRVRMMVTAGEFLAASPSTPGPYRSRRTKADLLGGSGARQRTTPHSHIGQASSLRGKRVLVTGGAGFIGSNLVDMLLDLGCEQVVVLDSMAQGHAQNLVRATLTDRLRLVEGDLRNPMIVRDAVAGVDTVFHQASPRATDCITNPRDAIEVMACATFDLLEECVRADVRKVVVASSALVYGAPDTFPTAERHPPYASRSLYGAAKSFTEGLLRVFNESYGTDYVTLRYFDVYGPRMAVEGRGTGTLITWIDRLAAGEPPVIFGRSLDTIDALHVEDIARANILAAQSSATDVTLNIGSGKETSMLALAQLLCRVMGRPDLEPVCWEDASAIPVARRWADVRAARRMIGFEPTVPLATGLSRLVDWWRGEQPVQKRLALG